ncbi:uncharacterized protein DUF4188 [Antricoccus suffuscus]|uniref:Uncharacterized protein DUF4188 n=1 Tax=Antricoccus suffuscus TaxID=1629062 RepID=A0A2T0ZXG8_9ACTN|nr:DUF4188 domain-containing protein [Antricoccus suffuscus]PRZ41051.1 uncharacterized protein DUF4188 [Antricoccus suffuscus]
MSKVYAGRYTAQPDQDVTVFLIGMRINKVHRPDKWVPVVNAMPRMLKHLVTHPDAGLLGFHNWFGRTTLLLSYWQSSQHLRRFASDNEAPHAEAWRAFRRNVGDDGIVGIWHETYDVPAQNLEVVYGNMPRFGLGKATAQVPVGRGSHTAKQRINRLRDTTSAVG